MSRERAIAHAERYFDEGGFFADLARRVAIPTESQNPERGADLARYLAGEMQPSFERLGFKCRVFGNPLGKGGPFLLAERIEDPALVTVLSYGHGDVIRGQENELAAGPRSLDAEARRRPALRPRHRRQQGPAFDQSGRHGGGNCRAGGSGFQPESTHRDGRGSRLSRAEGILFPQQKPSEGRCVHRLGRAAPAAGPADDLSRLARRVQHGPGGRPARRRPPFRQLGRAARQSGHHPRACARFHHRAERRNLRRRVAAGFADPVGARGALRPGSGRRPRRARAWIPTGASPA